MKHKTIKSNDIVSIYVGFVEGKGGKVRPVLAIEHKNNLLTFYRLTTQYKNKSSYIKEQYYQIKDWQQSGLKKPSYVDVGKTITIDSSSLKDYKRIGQLSLRDANNLSEFANKLYIQRENRQQ